MIFIVGWLLSVAVLVIIAVVGKRDWIKRGAKVLSIVMGSLTLIPLLLFCIVFIGCEPPSLASLSRKFSARRPTLEKIREFSDTEPALSRVDPTFIYYSAFDGYPAGEKSFGDSHSPLKADRWITYNKLFLKAGLHQGFIRDEAGDMFFMADSVGLLNSGHTTGYLYCVEPGFAHSKSSTFEPCAIPGADHGSRNNDLNNGGEAYTYSKVAEHWFVFDQGPS